MPDEKEWITVSEAAEKSGYSIRFIQRLLKDELIAGRKPGRDWFTTLEAVLHYKETAKRGRPKQNK